MAGSGVALAPSGMLNTQNPATLQQLESPIFNISLQNEWLKLSNGQQTESVRSAKLNGFNYGFKAGEKTGFSFGLAPMTTTGYNVTQEVALTDSSSYSQIFDGKGGLNQASLRLGRNLINKNDSLTLSLGVEVSYVFGTIERNRKIEFSDLTVHSTSRSERSTHSDLMFKTGLQFSFYPIKTKPLKVSAGVVYTPATKINRKFEQLTQNYTSSGSFTTQKDTASYLSTDDGFVKLPAETNVGVALAWKDNWLFTANYVNRDWTKYEQESTITTSSTSFSSSSRIALGVSYTPEKNIIFNSPIFNFVTYSIGAYSQKGYVQVNGNDLTEQGVTLGFNVPLRRSKSGSSIQFGMEYGKRGNVAEHLIEEQYTRILFGVNLRPTFVDRWFYKRKYD